MITFPGSYSVNAQNFIIGPARLWVAPYVSAGADAAQGNIVSLGMIDKAGVEFDHKPTVLDIESDAFATAVAGFLTKQQFDLKFNLEELSPTNLNYLLGLPASQSYGAGVSTQLLGEPMDVVGGASPSMRVLERQWIVQFPSSGHDNQSANGIGSYGYLQLYRAVISTHGAIKFSKDALAVANVTLRAYADLTVSGASKIGKLIQVF